MDIGILNYKYLGERYIIYESNGTGKEYYVYNDELIYEGEYLNGKKNGKGKEYYGSKILFEGEYLKGKRHGKGKEYYYDGNLLFEGEYFNGKRCKGKVYNKSGELIFEVDLNGKGKEYNDGKLIYEGEYLAGKRNGKGKIYDWLNRSRFEGEYLYGYKLKGREYINDKIEYEGEYLKGKKWNGKGYDENGNLIYELINGNGKVKEYNIAVILKFDD